MDLVLTLDAGGLEALFDRAQGNAEPETTAQSDDTDAKPRRGSAEPEVVQ